MADVFLSYASGDLALAEAVEGGLAQAGISVWRDKSRLQGGEPYAQIIQAAIDEANCVVALLTATSVQSNWVRTEMEAARSKLLPVLVPPVTLPIDFKALAGHLHQVDLGPWATAGAHDAWEQFIQSTAGFLQRAVKANQVPEPPAHLAHASVAIANSGEVKGVVGIVKGNVTLNFGDEN